MSSSRSRSRSPIEYSNRSGSPKDDSRQQSRSRSPLTDKDDRKSSSKYRNGDANKTYEQGETVEQEMMNKGTSLYIACVSRTVKERELEDLFSKYGKLEDVKILRDPHSGDSRGFGFVTFQDKSAAQAAMEALNGFDLQGRELVVEMAKRGKARTPTPGQYIGPPKPSRYSRPMAIRRPPPPYPYDNRRRADSYEPRYDNRYRDDGFPPRRGGGRDSYEPRYDDRYNDYRYDDRRNPDFYDHRRAPPPPRYDSRPRNPPPMNPRYLDSRDTWDRRGGFDTRPRVDRYEPDRDRGRYDRDSRPAVDSYRPN